MDTQDAGAEDILNDTSSHRNPERPRIEHRLRAHLQYPEGAVRSIENPEEGGTDDPPREPPDTAQLGRGGLKRHLSELSFRHFTPKTWAYSRVFGFFRI